MRMLAVCLFLAVLVGSRARHRFHFAHIEIAGDDFLRQLFGIRFADQHARVTGGEFAVLDIALHRIREFQEPQRVGDVAAALADNPGDLFLAVVKLLHQRAIAFRFFQRVEVGALNILDDGELQRFRIRRLDDDDRHFVQAGALRGAPAPFAGDDLVAVRDAAQRAHDDRLNDAAFAQRRRELFKFDGSKYAPRIAGVRPQRAGRQPPLRARPLD